MILMKKLSTYLFLILFSFSAPSFADDISDFQIEGMSIGDSALNYFSEREIKTMTKHIYPNNIYIGLIFKSPKLNTYDLVQFDLDKEKNYEIIRIVGRLKFKDNINECYKIKDQIVSEVSGIFSESVKIKSFTKPLSKSADKTGKSIGTTTNFNFENTESFIQVMCRNYSKESGRTHSLNVEIWSDKYTKYLKTL